ncbi:hypothetical protein D9615_009172 [Tricholomella constricta]|uniref:Uncharacterized protein n=1 Tax=Tricholomella constricta TaxID=117010 RepID=A0A8H5H2E2_9AGAR|nr:hypothetical protein D9615_009172 [Tricholomella constricta]
MQEKTSNPTTLAVLAALGSNKAPASRPVTPVFDLPSCDVSFSSEDDEHTLCAYGDISLSNVYFVPGLPSEVSPRRDTAWLKKESKQTPPPSPRKISALNIEHPLPSVIQKILPPSPSAAQLSPGTDFERLVAKLRETRLSEKSPPHPGLAMPSPSKPIHQPQPRHAINLKAIGNLNAKVNHGGVSARSIKEQGLFLPTARLDAPKPKLKEKPFRGGKLPVRPPLPRWDLHDAVVPKKGEPRALYGGVPTKVMNRT